MTPIQLAEQIEKGIIGADGLALIGSERRLIVDALRAYTGPADCPQCTRPADKALADACGEHPCPMRAALSHVAAPCSKCGKTPPFPGGTRCQDLQCPFIQWSNTTAPSSTRRTDPFDENDVARRLRNFRLDPVVAGQRWEGQALDATMVEAAGLIDRLEKQLADQSMSVLVPVGEYDKMKAALSATLAMNRMERHHLAEWHEQLAKLADQSDDFNGAAFHQGRAEEIRRSDGTVDQVLSCDPSAIKTAPDGWRQCKACGVSGDADTIMLCRRTGKLPG
jgi:hypothetical protein